MEEWDHKRACVCVCNCQSRYNEKHLKVHNPRHCWFNSWLSERISETALPLIISAVFFL